MIEWTGSNAIWIAMALPLLAICWVFLFGKVPNLREAGSIAVSVVLFGVNISLSKLVFNGGRPEFCLGEMLPGFCLLYTSPSPRDKRQSRMPSSA